MEDEVVNAHGYFQPGAQGHGSPLLSEPPPMSPEFLSFPAQDLTLGKAESWGGELDIVPHPRAQWR